MACDLFNNNRGGYIDPGLAPCAGDSDNNYLEFVKGGIGIVSGINVKTRIDFSDLSIPVDSWNQQIQNVGPGEVVYIAGLTKGLSNRGQGYSMPNLNSTDETLNPYFLILDLSINYYKNFSYTISSIDASGNYITNIDLATDLNSKFGEKDIKVLSTYDTSTLLFTGQQAGYDFDISNVILNVIDASQDINSPFPPFIINGQRVQQTYNLVLDASKNVDAARYPNTAMRGVVMKIDYPYESDANVLCSDDKWVYINHAKTYVDICTPVELNFNTDVSSGVIIQYDSSTFLGIKPIIIDDVSIADVSLNISFFIEDVSLIDGSLGPIIGEIIDSSIVNNYNIFDSSIVDSSILNSFITLSDVSLSYLNGNSINGSIINLSTVIDTSIVSTDITDSILTGSTTQNGIITSSEIIDSYAKETDIYDSSISNTYFLGDASSFSIIDNAEFNTAWILNYNINNSFITSGILSIGNSRIDNLTDVSSGTLKTQDTSIFNSNLNNGETYNSFITDSSISNLIGDFTKIFGSQINSGSLNDSKTWNSFLFENQIQNSSIIFSTFNGLMDRSEAFDSSLNNSIITNSELIRSNIWDSSINDGIFNENTIVSDSTIINSWSNVFVLVTNPSTGDKIYIMDDPTLLLDSSAWRVNINNSLIWDSSFNNTTISDSSIYRTYFQDVSLVRCTTYNCIFENSVEVDSRTMLIEASIYCDVSISSDTSIYYSKTTKKLNVGLSGCSSDDTISAGDYLNWVTENNNWIKIGDMYNITGPSDSSSMINLLNGFYVYNAHTYSINLNYLVFV